MVVLMVPDDEKKEMPGALLFVFLCFGSCFFPRKKREGGGQNVLVEMFGAVSFFSFFFMVW